MARVSKQLGVKEAMNLTLGLENDKASTMMMSRVACFGKICHNSKTYSGTLSRHLLAYQSMISNVQASLRDLIEMILVAMFLEGSIDRDRDDWMDLSLGYTPSSIKQQYLFG